MSQRTEDISTVEHTPPWPKQGPASYFPSIEKKYGRSIAEWQQIIAPCGLEKHMAIVEYLKSEYGMGHGHANALVGWTLKGFAELKDPVWDQLKTYGIADRIGEGYRFPRIGTAVKGCVEQTGTAWGDPNPD